MKTTDLIPLILLELNESDKYGFELTKSIESKSNGKIVIKQPTLYTVLKKLEKSKFISSYWQDSDIGGKRHYYKITDNGRMQVSTLPDFFTLINNALKDEQSEPIDSKKEELSPSSLEVPVHSEEKQIEEMNTNSRNSFSIMDVITDAVEENKQEESKKLNISYVEKNDELLIAPELRESVLSSEEVFADDNLDNMTDNTINESNLGVLKNDSATDTFASNENISTFTQKQTELPKEYKEEIITKTLDNFIIKDATVESSKFNYQDVKYVDYIDFTTDKKHVKAKTISNKLTMSVCLTSLYLFIAILLSTLCVRFSGASPLFYSTIIISSVILIFYPTLYFVKKERIRLHLVNNTYKPDFKKQTIVAIAIELAVLLACIIVNISSGNYNLISMFSVRNFENIYAEILISSSIFIDILLKYLFTKKYISLE